MRFLEAQEIIELNKTVLLAGEKHTVINKNGLESAAGRHKWFEDVFQSAAALIQSILVNHPFEQGNKRTAFVAGQHILENEGHYFSMDHVKIADRIERMVVDRWPRQRIAQWIKKHTAVR